MRSNVIVSLALAAMMTILLIPSAIAQHYFADHFYLPPPPPPPPPEEPETVEKSLHDRRYPLPETTVRAWLAQPMPDYGLDGFDVGATATKQLLDNAPPHQVAINYPLNVEAANLFGTPLLDGGNRVYLVSLTSPGAYALRLRVNTLGLRPGDQLWLLDAEGAAAFGPFTSGNAESGGQWLPPTVGDEVVLAVTSPDDTLPLLMVMEMAHFYKPIIEKALPTPLTCNIPIAQETNDTAQQVAAGVGRLLVPFANGQGLCTTTLINSFKTVSGVPAPYIVCAWHCFGPSAYYDGIAVYWDYRSASGNGDDVPDLYDLNFNIGATLIDNSLVLDFTLLELKSEVAVGPYGRAWAGWDSVPPEDNASVQVTHHPVGADLKTSRGTITNSSTNICMNVTCSARYEKQIEIHWNEGVTEQGSSGSALLIRNNNYRIAGVLSNGTMHSCTDASNNVDNFGPFHAFFPQIGCYLVNDYVCQPPYEPEPSGCFLFRKMGLSAEMLYNLRSFRDNVLGKSDLGRHLIQDYYRNTNELEGWVDSDRVVRILFEGVLTLGAAWGATLH